MEVSGQLHAPATSPMREEPQIVRASLGILEKRKRICSKLNIQIGSRAHPSSFSVNNEGSHKG